MGFLDLFRSKPASPIITRPPSVQSAKPAVIVTDPKTGEMKVQKVASRGMGRWAAGTAAAAALYTFIGGNEGIVQVAYPDPVSKGEPWTICLGHTGSDVTPGLRASMQQCRILFLQDIAKEQKFIDKCAPNNAEWSDSVAVAVFDLAHNIGGFGACNSSVIRKLNAGDRLGACDAFLGYDHAMGMRIKSLTARRQRDRKLCLENIDYRTQ